MGKPEESKPQGMASERAAVKEAQLEGKSRASGAQLLQQLQAQVGDRLGD